MTHPDSDHVGGLIPVIENYQIKNILDPGFEGKHTNLYKDFCDLSKSESNCKFYKPLIGTLIKKEGEELNWGKELKVKVLRAEKNVTDVNNSSIVIWLKYGKVSFLLAGDIEGKERKADPSVSKWAEGDLVKKYDGNLKSTFLKIPHHGSESSSTNAFITAVSPKYGIICAGNKKFQGTLLPDDSVVKRYKKAGVIIYRTDRDDQNKNYSKTSGDDHVIVTTDGTLKGTKIKYWDEN